jgi:hypothetical protein
MSAPPLLLAECTSFIMAIGSNLALQLALHYLPFFECIHSKLCWLQLLSKN